MLLEPTTGMNQGYPGHNYPTTISALPERPTFGNNVVVVTDVPTEAVYYRSRLPLTGPNVVDGGLGFIFGPSNCNASYYWCPPHNGINTNLESSPDLSLLSMSPLSHTLQELAGEDGSPHLLGDMSLQPALFSDRDQERLDLSHLESFASNTPPYPHFLVDEPAATFESPRRETHETLSPLMLPEELSVHSSPEDRHFILPLSDRSAYLTTPSRRLTDVENHYPFFGHPANSMTALTSANGSISVSSNSDTSPASRNSLRLIDHLPSDSSYVPTTSVILPIAESRACIEQDDSAKDSDQATTTTHYLYSPSAVERSRQSIQIPEYSDSPRLTISDRLLSSPFPPTPLSQSDFESGSEAGNSMSGRKIASEAALAASEKRRKKDAKHQCPICPQKLTSRDNLLSHTDAHRGIKRFSCELCGYRFRTRAVLKRHQRGARCHKLQDLKSQPITLQKN